MSGVAGVTSKTALYGVIGFPVRHSLSPLMQTAAFASEGIDACYLAFEVAPGDFPKAVDGAFHLGAMGLNVTVPYKRAAFELAVERDASAQNTGAANTLTRCEGGWRAYNTDVAGFVGAVREAPGFSIEGGRAAVLGAGGAARAAVVGMVEAGAREVIVAARDEEKAARLALELGGASRGVTSCSVAKVPDVLDKGDLLVSATPLGLEPDGDWPWPLKVFRSGVLVYDMAYAKGETSLVRKAIEAGFKATSGRMMLVRQGAEAFSLWTGRKPPLDVMVRAIGTPLEGVNQPGGINVEKDR